MVGKRGESGSPTWVTRRMGDIHRGGDSCWPVKVMTSGCHTALEVSVRQQVLCSMGRPMGDEGWRYTPAVILRKVIVEFIKQ